MKVYKILNEQMESGTTMGQYTEWKLGKTKYIRKETNEQYNSNLCSPAFFHWYLDPYLALLWNEKHAGIYPAVVFEAEASGKIEYRHDAFKGGSTRLKILRKTRFVRQPDNDALKRITCMLVESLLFRFPYKARKFLTTAIKAYHDGRLNDGDIVHEYVGGAFCTWHEINISNYTMRILSSAGSSSMKARFRDLCRDLMQDPGYYDMTEEEMFEFITTTIHLNGPFKKE